MVAGGIEGGVEDAFYVRGGDESLTDEIGACIYAVDAVDEVSTIAFEEYNVLGPADVFV